jgi:hypothetical protein
MEMIIHINILLAVNNVYVFLDTIGGHTMHVRMA